MRTKSSTYMRLYRVASAVRDAAMVFLVAACIFAVLAWRDASKTPAPPVLAQAPVAAPLPLALEPVAPPPDPHADTHRRLGDYLARRYRVSAAAATHIVEKAFSVGHRLELDPVLILAIIAVESRFNPIAESTMGAKGLMQVMSRLHAEKFRSFGGEAMAFEVEPNITVGARILKEYLRFTGDLVDALQLYVGASSEEDGNQYSEKVTRELERLKQVARRRSST